MVRRLFPAARLFGYFDLADLTRQRRRRPDMVEPAALVRGLPIGRAIAPPGVELLRFRRKMPHRVEPVPDLLHGGELLALRRRMRHDADHLLVAPDVVLE